MKSLLRCALPAVLTAALTPLAYAQSASPAGSYGPFYKFHQADVGVAATGQFTTDITNNVIGASGVTLPHQGETDSPGVLFTLRDHPFSWAGVEFNYQYTRFSEHYARTQPGSATGVANNPVDIATNFHEATAAYLFHLNLHKIKPYVAIGGGGLDFQPISVDRNQWRSAGLVDLGLDMQTHSRLGFRIGARDLIYRAPTFNDPTLSAGRWQSTEEPYGGVYIKF